MFCVNLQGLGAGIALTFTARGWLMPVSICIDKIRGDLPTPCDVEAIFFQIEPKRLQLDHPKKRLE